MDVVWHRNIVIVEVAVSHQMTNDAVVFAALQEVVLAVAVPNNWVPCKE
jgi:hypothetical protein